MIISIPKFDYQFLFSNHFLEADQRPWVRSGQQTI